MTTVGRVLRWLGALVLAGVLAWVASNVIDASPGPQPPALALPPAPEGSPLFFRMQGLNAPAGQSTEAAGRAAWAALHAPGGAASAPAAAAGPGGPPLACRAPDDCPAKLAASLPAIREQLQPHDGFGARCTEAVADLRYVEARPPRMTPDTPLPIYQHAVQCGHWFKGQALLAAAAGDREAAVRQLRHAEGLGRALFDHSPMLIGRMVGAAIVRGRDDGLLAVALMQPGWSAELAPLAETLPPQALDPRPWLVMEAAWVRGAVDAMAESCGADPAAAGASGLGRLADLGCRWRIGFLPEATRQGLDALWLPQVQAAEGGLQPALQRALEARGNPPPPSSTLAWRNPIGQGLLAVARPDLSDYLARVADVDLQRRATALVLAAAAVPAAERSAWLQARDLPAPLRARLAWSADGARLQVKPWWGEFPGTDARRQPYALTVPAATAP